ncbi:MAG: alpha/beta fold hydrolase [Chloroflexota bacterium]|nr:alpha/beta fold hydrolase [Chloroflexota bacterium]
MALSVWLSSLAALPLSRSGSLNWRHADQAESTALQEALAQADPEALARALGAEAATRIGTFLAGIEGYRAHPYRRRLKDPPVLWQAGTTRVLDFGGDAAGAPVLLVPSLINRAYILDLTAQRSFTRYLRERGLRPYLLDWEAPGADERQFGLDDYILGRLVPALEAVRRDAGRPVVLAGYCMGGTMVLPLAARTDVAALVLLATPWDFWADSRHQARLIAAHLPGLTALIDGLEQLPPDALQAMFAALDPLLAARKFCAFAALPPTSAAARNFVALEDWLNDAVPLTGSVARACLNDWYGANAPARGNWRVGDEAVRPERVTCPALNVVPARDRIVPPASAEALSDALPHVETWRPPLGHIGMMASPRAKRLLWRKLSAWVAANAAK